MNELLRKGVSEWPGYLSAKNVINLSNGVLGISVLTMPYCFESCGIVLATVTLMLSGLMTSYSCKLLMDTAQAKKSTNLEFLALHLYGPVGKVLYELSIILLLFGSLVTYTQTINFSLPSMVANFLNVEHSRVNGPLFTLCIMVCVVMPLSLIKSINTLSRFNKFSVFCYLFFCLYLLAAAVAKLTTESHVLGAIKLWDLSGVLTCFPIFCIAFSIQQVMFHFYEELSWEDKQGMPVLLDCSIVFAFLIYASVGVLGYVANCDVEISGSYMRMMPATAASNLLLLGLNASILSGYPYMVFPCRHSLNTLLFPFRTSGKSSDVDAEFIPHNRFISLSLALVFCVSVVAFLIPNVAFVISLTGSTTGVIACFIWPALFYVAADANNSKSKTLKAFFLVCIFMFVVCTFDILQQYQPTKQELDMSETTRLDVKVISSRLNSSREIFLTPRLDLLEHEQESEESRGVTRLEPANPDEAEVLAKPSAEEAALDGASEQSSNGSKIIGSIRERALARVKRK